MGNWLYRATIIGFWLVSMGWLLTTKILPPLFTGSPPQYSQILPGKAAAEPRVHWQILWREGKIGNASTEIVRHSDGTGTISSDVSFDELPISQLLSDFLGGASALIQPVLQIDGDVRISLNVKSKTVLDHFGELSRFDTNVNVDGFDELLQLRGIVDRSKLKVSARLGDSSLPLSQREIFKRTFDLPPNGLISDAVAPNSKMVSLRVGQTWNLQVYNPFSPTSPMELVQAKVASRDLIDWNGQVLQAKLVEYRRQAGSGLSTSREPIARMWVAKDGMVVKQEATLGKSKIVFLRVVETEETGTDKAESATNKNPASP